MSIKIIDGQVRAFGTTYVVGQTIKLTADEEAKLVSLNTAEYVDQEDVLAPITYKVSSEYKVNYLGASTGTKPSTAEIGSKFYEENTGKRYIWNGESWIETSDDDDITTVIQTTHDNLKVNAKVTDDENVLKINANGSVDTNANMQVDNTNVNTHNPVPVTTLKGIVTEGLDGLLIDSTKDFEADVLNGKTIVLTVDGIDYYRTVLGCVGDSILFTPILEPLSASATVGDGLETNGQISISCIGDLKGAIGNQYSVQVVQGTGTTGMDYAELDEENKLLLITVDLTALSQPRTLAAGSLQTLINGTEGIRDKFMVALEFMPGNIPMMAEAVLFTDGEDGISVSAGDTYKIIEPKTADVNIDGSIGIKDTTSTSSKYIGDTTETTPYAGKVFTAIQFLQDTIFANLTGTLSGTLTGITFSQGLIIYGRFTAITLASGSVIAYEGV
jgi:hypothetical protein